MDPTAINEQIERILHSKSLATKGQLRKLLEVLHENIDSQAALTTELVVQELWPTEIKTKHAKDVATEMNRLRRAVGSYYRGEGKTDLVVIYFPKRAPMGNGHQETRWIGAVLRDGAEAPMSVQLLSPETVQAPVPPPSTEVDGRRAWKRVALIAAPCIAMGIVACAYILKMGAYR